MSSSIQYVLADLDLPAHQDAVVAMVDAYSRDAFGDAKPLNEDAKARLVPGLRATPTSEIVLAIDGDQPVGIAVCFRCFSTFAARPNLNLHDLTVVPSHRGRGIGKGLLRAAEARARELGCCKLTLEVLDQNHRALGAYLNFGFKRYALRPGAGEAIFLTKELQ